MQDGITPDDVNAFCWRAFLRLESCLATCFSLSTLPITDVRASEGLPVPRWIDPQDGTSEPQQGMEVPYSPSSSSQIKVIQQLIKAGLPFEGVGTSPSADLDGIETGIGPTL